MLHDLNEDPILPFEDGTFDVVLNTVSVDYMTRPLEVFREIARILKPGGLFLVIFSNRMFPQKAVKIWKESNEAERVMLVEDFFRVTDDFEPARVFVSKGKPATDGRQIRLPRDSQRSDLCGVCRQEGRKSRSPRKTAAQVGFRGDNGPGPGGGKKCAGQEFPYLSILRRGG